MYEQLKAAGKLSQDDGALEKEFGNQSPTKKAEEAKAKEAAAKKTAEKTIKSEIKKNS